MDEELKKQIEETDELLEKFSKGSIELVKCETIPVLEADFERFLGEKSKELEERILETREVFERLKDK